jgi:hypothetical protein
MPSYVDGWFGKQAEGEFVEDAEDTIVFAQSVTCWIETTQSVSDSIPFTSTGDEFHQLGIASNTINFAQDVSVTREVPATAESLIAFGQNAEQVQVIVLDLENDIVLGQSFNILKELNRALTQNIHLEGTVHPTYEGELESDVVLDNSISWGEGPNNDIGVDNEIVGELSKGLSNGLTIGQVIVIWLERDRELENEITLGNSILAFIDRSCDQHEYIGTGLPAAPSLDVRDGIQFAYGLLTLNLRNPDFGDTVEAQPQRAVNRSMGGTVNLFRSNIWPRKTVIQFTVTFPDCDDGKKEEILDFYEATLGQIVTYTDSENREWTGVLTMPSNPVVHDSRGWFKASFIFRGEPV